MDWCILSQLAWSRVNHPSELFKVGQEVEVQVLSVDKEMVSLEDEGPYNELIQSEKESRRARQARVSDNPFSFNPS